MNKKQTRIFNVIMIVAIILLTIATVPKTLQEDTYYMIKVGEYICENGMSVIADKIEPFAWVEGITYTYPHWLLDVVFYQVYNAFDFTGIYVFTVLAGIIIYLLLYYTNVKVAKNHIISAIITIVSIYFLSGFIAARAQVITFICLILEVLFIEKFLETGKIRYVIGLILDPILLANCHAALFPIYFVVFLPYIAEYLWTFITKKNVFNIRIKKQEFAIKRLNKSIMKNKNLTASKGQTLEKINKKIEKKNIKLEKKQAKILRLTNRLKEIELEKEYNKKDGKVIVERNKRAKYLILIFIICLFTGLLTPLGDIPYTYMLKSIQGNTMNFISEHQPVTLIYDYSLLIIFVVMIVLIFSNKVKIKLRDLFMLMGMTILSLISYKQFPIFFICTMCIVNKMMLMLITNYKKKRQDRKQAVQKQMLELADNTGKEIEKPKVNFIKEKIKEIPSKILTIKGAVYVVLVIAIIAMLQYRTIAAQSYVDSSSYPTLAAEWLKENVDIENMRLFNDFNYGSYLLFQDIPVFIDGRADVYDPVFNGKEDDVYLDYMQASSLSVWYEEVFKKYDITHIITTASSTLNTYLQRNVSYRMIYNDGSFAIYETRYSD